MCEDLAVSQGAEATGVQHYASLTTTVLREADSLL